LEKEIFNRSSREQYIHVLEQHINHSFYICVNISTKFNKIPRVNFLIGVSIFLQCNCVGDDGWISGIADFRKGLQNNELH
jgi:hypothetical protein